MDTNVYRSTRFIKTSKHLTLTYLITRSRLSEDLETEHDEKAKQQLNQGLKQHIRQFYDRPILNL